MRSLSYIIILMSLIGNCQSEKISCIQNKIKCCQSAIDQSTSKIEAQQLLKEFKHFISKYNQKYKKQNVFADLTPELNSVYQKHLKKSSVKLSFNEVFGLQKKTSVIRNKDQLDFKILI